MAELKFSNNENYGSLGFSIVEVLVWQLVPLPCEGVESMFPNPNHIAFMQCHYPIGTLREQSISARVMALAADQPWISLANLSPLYRSLGAVSNKSVARH